MKASDRTEAAGDFDQLASEFRYAAERLEAGEDSIEDILIDVGEQWETARRVTEFLRERQDEDEDEDDDDG